MTAIVAAPNTPSGGQPMRGPCARLAGTLIALFRDDRGFRTVFEGATWVVACCRRVRVSQSER